jgi:Mn2+/Fe2+ NRAMP family transporter
MIVIQQMCGRIGTVTGKGLAGVIPEHYYRKDIMGQFVNSRASDILGWMIVLIMALSGVALIFSLANGQ